MARVIFPAVHLRTQRFKVKPTWTLNEARPSPPLIDSAPSAEGGDGSGEAVAIDWDALVVGAWQKDSSKNTVTNGATASSDNSAPLSGATHIVR